MSDHNQKIGIQVGEMKFGLREFLRYLVGGFFIVVCVTVVVPDSVSKVRGALGDALGGIACVAIGAVAYAAYPPLIGRKIIYPLIHKLEEALITEWNDDPGSLCRAKRLLWRQKALRANRKLKKGRSRLCREHLLREEYSLARGDEWVTWALIRDKYLRQEDPTLIANLNTDHSEMHSLYVASITLVTTGIWSTVAGHTTGLFAVALGVVLFISTLYGDGLLCRREGSLLLVAINEEKSTIGDLLTRSGIRSTAAHSDESTN